ncbi:MAG: cupin domain-containing protein [Phycisphaerales bacterium]|nr:cupin domain-containing protein [Phycisphaerales bacterium]
MVWGDLYSFKTTSAESNGAHALLEMTVNPGSATPPHIHHAEDEMFYVLEGELSLWCGDQKIVGKPGSFIAVPKGMVHRWANETKSPARSLVFLVPGGFDEFLMKIGKPATDSVKPSLPPTKEEIDFALSIAGKYHMEVVTQ